MLQYIIFDFDGTIANSSIVFMNGWNKFADQYGYLPVDEGDILQARTMTIQECAKKFKFPMYKMPIILPKIYGYVNEHINEVTIYEGMKEVLFRLKEQGYKLCILSSNNRSNIERFLQLQQISCIDEVLTSSKLFGKDKILRLFMKQHNVGTKEIFYIGDELRDIEACNKCDINFGWASWGLHGYELIAPKNPSLIFNMPADITNQLIL